MNSALNGKLETLIWWSNITPTADQNGAQNFHFHQLVHQCTAITLPPSGRKKQVKENKNSKSNMYKVTKPTNSGKKT